MDANACRNLSQHKRRRIGTNSSKEDSLPTVVIGNPESALTSVMPCIAEEARAAVSDHLPPALPIVNIKANQAHVEHGRSAQGWFHSTDRMIEPQNYPCTFASISDITPAEEDMDTLMLEAEASPPWVNFWKPRVPHFTNPHVADDGKFGTPERNDTDNVFDFEATPDFKAAKVSQSTLIVPFDAADCAF